MNFPSPSIKAMKNPIHLPQISPSPGARSSGAGAAVVPQWWFDQGL